MAKKFKKYEYISEEEANLYIDNLGYEIDEDGNKYPTHGNHIVKIGYIVLEQGTYDEEGNELTPPIFSDKYSVDVIWVNGKDKDWKDKRIKLNGNKNSHSFYGWEYSDDTI